MGGGRAEQHSTLMKSLFTNPLAPWQPAVRGYSRSNYLMEGVRGTWLARGIVGSANQEPGESWRHRGPKEGDASRLQRIVSSMFLFRRVPLGICSDKLVRCILFILPFFYWSHRYVSFLSADTCRRLSWADVKNINKSTVHILSELLLFIGRLNELFPKIKQKEEREKR